MSVCHVHAHVRSGTVLIHIHEISDNFKIALGVSRAQSILKQHARGKARPTMQCIRLVQPCLVVAPHVSQSCMQPVQLPYE